MSVKTVMTWLQHHDDFFAMLLEDLRIPPGNRLLALRANRSGQYSIRVNNQYRVCFAWTGQEPTEVEIDDYH
jgi:proteic killer suppression protein